jgi:hypothetical protein
MSHDNSVTSSPRRAFPRGCAILASTLALVAGCSSPSADVSQEAGGEPIASTSSPLMTWEYYPGYPGNNVIPYGYYERSPYYPFSRFPGTTMYAGSTYHSTIENELERTWSSVSNLVFNYVGSAFPAPPTDNMIVVSIENREAGYTDEGVSGGYAKAYVHLSNSGLGNGVSAPHEFGHGIGFSDEERRSGYPGPCIPMNVRNGDPLNTAVDSSGLMTSCMHWSPSLWDAIGAQTQYGPRVTDLIPMATWTLDGVEQTTLMSTAWFEGFSGMGYKPTRPEGWVWTRNVPNTVPVYLYYSPWSSDMTLAASQTTMSVLSSLGYNRIEQPLGYVYSSATLENNSTAENLIQLTLYFKTLNNGDYDYYDFVTAADDASKTALASQGYTALWSEGYVFAKRPYVLLRNYWRSQYGNPIERTSTALESNLWTTLNKYGSGWGKAPTGKFDSAILTKQAYGTLPLKTFYNASRKDYFTCAQTCPAGNSYTLDGATYTYQQTEGYVFASTDTGRPLTRYYRSALQDHYTTGWTGISLYYTSQAFEGYGLALTVGN